MCKFRRSKRFRIIDGIQYHSTTCIKCGNDQLISSIAGQHSTKVQIFTLAESWSEQRGIFLCVNIHPWPSRGFTIVGRIEASSPQAASKHLTVLPPLSLISLYPPETLFVKEKYQWARSLESWPNFQRWIFFFQKSTCLKSLKITLHKNPMGPIL